MNKNKYNILIFLIMGFALLFLCGAVGCDTDDGDDETETTTTTVVDSDDDDEDTDDGTEATTTIVDGGVGDDEGDDDEYNDTGVEIVVSEPVAIYSGYCVWEVFGRCEDIYFIGDPMLFEGADFTKPCTDHFDVYGEDPHYMHAECFPVDEWVDRCNPEDYIASCDYINTYISKGSWDSPNMCLGGIMYYSDVGDSSIDPRDGSIAIYGEEEACTERAGGEWNEW